jgi:hypothetical protein
MPELIIGTERFAVREHVDEWSLMKLAKSQTADHPMAALAGMFDFINAMVKPEERDRLDAYLSNREVESGALSEAVGNLIQEYSGRPTARPSSSQGGGPLTPPKSKVVSFSQGTVREVEESPKDGQSAVS